MSRQLAGTRNLGMIGEERPSPPMFPFAVTLYKTDGLFRALIDLTVVGLLTLLFAWLSGWGGASQSKRNSASPTATSQQSSAKTVPSVPPKTLGTMVAGALSLEAARTMTIDDKVLAGVPQPVADKIKLARTSLEENNPDAALTILGNLDPAEPAVAYAQAVATLHKPGPGRALEAMRIIRNATKQGFAPAFTLAGMILSRLVNLDERGQLPASERVTLDGAGNVVPATREELAHEAVQWWERGAAFHDPAAIRMLGMAEARGFDGRKNLSAAISYWRDAARGGDAAAQTELGTLYMSGMGVEADPDKAAQYLRDAADQGFAPAYLALGMALKGPASSGDVAAAREAIGAFEQVIRTTEEKRAQGVAHLALAILFGNAAPSELRDPKLAAAHLHAAWALNMPLSAYLLAQAYRTGVGVEQDKAFAYTLLQSVAGHDKSAAKELATLTSQLSREELQRGQAIRLRPLPLPLFAVAELASEGLFSETSKSLIGRDLSLPRPSGMSSLEARPNASLPRFDDVTRQNGLPSHRKLAPAGGSAADVE